MSGRNTKIYKNINAMVKKVIDIIPPEKPSVQGQSETDFPVQGSFGMPQIPSSEIPIEEEKIIAKPKLTYVSNPVNERPKAPRPKGSFLRGLLLKLAIFVVVVLGAMYAIDLRFAKAVVRIWPETSVLAQESKVIVDVAAKSADLEKGSVPGITILFDDAIKGESAVKTMKKSLGKAQGMVKIFNKYTSTQRLVKGTRLQAPLEKFQPALSKDEVPWFRTAEDVVLEPKSSATVKVIADGSGEKFNIEPSVFSVPGLVGTAQYTFVYGQSFEKFTGGTQGDSPEVAQVDLDNAKTFIISQANEEIKKKLIEQVPQGYVLLEETIKTNLETPVISAKVGDAVAKINTEVRGKSSAIAYRQSDIDNLGKDFILNKVPAGSVADTKSIDIKSSYGGVDPAGNRPFLSLNAKVTVYKGMEDTDLKKGLSEKSAKEANIFLMGQPGMKDVKIQLTPVWRTNIPRDLDRIEVQTILE